MEQNKFSIGKEVYKAARWFFVSQAVRYGVGFVSVIILARYLGPEEYGLAAIAVSITAFFSVITQFGFSSAIIGEKKVDRQFINSIFTLSLIIGVSLYIVLFILAPSLAQWYHNPDLTVLLRIGGLGLLFALLMGIPLAILQRGLRYRAQANMEIGLSFIGAVIAIFLAIYDFGVWALIIPALIKSVLGALIGHIVSGYWPGFDFNLECLRRARNFSLSAFVSNLANFFCNNIVPIALGRIWTPAVLGFYSFAHSKYSLLFDFIAGLFTGSLFPILSRVSDNVERMRVSFLRLIRLGLFVIFPVYIILIQGAPVLFPIIFGVRWNIAIVPFQILCVFPIIRSLGLGSNLVLYARRKPQISAKVVVWRVVGFASMVALTFFLRLSLISVIIALLIIDSIISTTYLVCALKEAGGSFREYILSIKDPVVLGLAMLLFYTVGVIFVRMIYPSSHSVAQFLISGLLASLLYLLIGLRPLLAEWRSIRASLRSSCL